MLVKPNAGQPAKIKVVGIGGGGGNALATMIAGDDIVGVEFIAMNTDSQALLNSKGDVKIQIGETLTKGLGSGGDPDIGLKAAEESRETIKETLESSDMIFIAAGEGGGTGTGASPIVAQLAKETGALTVAVVTKPFNFEGAKRMAVAEEGIARLKEHVDTLIVIPNQKVLEIIDAKISILEAFKKVDSILHQGVKGIAELITTPGLINVDFADVRTVMTNAGTALMGMGVGTGDKRTIAAIKQAISSPLLEVSIDGARGVLFTVTGGPDLSMSEVDEAASIIAKTAAPDADIIFGAIIDEKMMDQVKITVIATKFDEEVLNIAQIGPSVSPSSRNTSSLKDDVDAILEDENEEKETEAQDEEPGKRNDNFDDDGEFDVPTFLRKK